MSDMRKILVTGATGKQGGAVIEALLAKSHPYDLDILALTRNPNSASAKKLASNPKIKVIAGDLDDVSAVFVKAGGSGSIWGVFSVQVPAMGHKGPIEENKEVIQGCALVDAAIANKVTHFVYSSVDRGGEKSDQNPTQIAHFITKHNIEQHLKKAAKDTDMTYTILRPVAFMDNFPPGFPGRVFAAMWAQLGDKKLQIVATKDIGAFAAMAFDSPDTDEFKNHAIALAGDELNQAEANEVMWRALGRPMIKSYSFMPGILQWMIPEVGTMFQWFKDEGYGADIAKCKRLNGGTMDFGTWLKEESKFAR